MLALRATDRLNDGDGEGDILELPANYDEFAQVAGLTAFGGSWWQELTCALPLFHFGTNGAA